MEREPELLLGGQALQTSGTWQWKVVAGCCPSGSKGKGCHCLSDAGGGTLEPSNVTER